MMQSSVSLNEENHCQMKDDRRILEGMTSGEFAHEILSKSILFDAKEKVGLCCLFHIMDDREREKKKISLFALSLSLSKIISSFFVYFVDMHPTQLRFAVIYVRPISLYSVY